MDISPKKVYKCPVHMRRCSPSLVIRRMQTKAAVNSLFTLASTADNHSSGEDMEKLESLHVADRNVKQCNHFGKQTGISSKS